ncbi:MAG: tandem-95 repeat protein [Sphingosinicella sp.]|uniref:tandem-95 repeat protein n=1 Tax=Sphingosinicella sp. TaxID=1917971 RepID=UPI00403844C6
MEPDEFVYEFDFSNGLGAWASWMPPSLIQGDPTHGSFTRIHAPGQLDPNHLDGIGALWLVSSLAIGRPTSLGSIDLRDAEIEITIKGKDFDPNGAKLIFWVCTYLPEANLYFNYPVGLQVTNWAHTGGDFADQITDEWQTITVTLSSDPLDWGYGGNNISGQGDWAYRYMPLDLTTTLSQADATLHLLLLGDSPTDRPSGFLDIANITIKAKSPAEQDVADPGFVFGVEDEPVAGQLTDPGGHPDAVYLLVPGSVRNGSVEIDANTGSYVFTPTANYYGREFITDAASFQYTVTSSEGTSGPIPVTLYIAPINDAPLLTSMDEDVVIAANEAFEFTLFRGSDIDGDTPTFHLVDGSLSAGTLDLDSRSGHYVFTPGSGFSGDVTFQYVVSDGQATSGPKTVTITVRPPNDPPVLPSFGEVAEYFVQGDMPAFIYWATRLAFAGDPNASYHYGTWLQFDQNVNRDTTAAAFFLEQALPSGVQANLQLAALYYAGDGVPQDYARAQELLSQYPNHAPSRYRLGVLVDNGFGSAVDDAAAANHYIAAAKLGSADAMYTLGLRFFFGEGVQASASDAYFWLGVGLKFNGGPPIAQFRDYLQANQNEAAASLTAQQIASLDAAIANWTPGSPTPVNAIAGSALDDVIVGNGLDNSITGGAGDDRLIGHAGNNVLDGGTGIDTADYSTAPGGVSVNLNSDKAPANGYGGSDTLLGIEHAIGSALADTLIGNALGNRLEGGAGADYLIGMAGNDILIGGAGAANQLQGGTGDDWYYISASGDSIIEFAGEGYDRIYASVNYVLSAGREIEFISAADQAGTGALNLTGNAFGQVLWGNAGANILTGGGGTDTLIGGAGDDTLYGNADANSTLQGGTGDDWYYISRTGDSLVELAGQGNDRIVTSVSYTLSAGQEIEVISTANLAGTLAINLVGNGFGQTLLGNNGANTLSGGGGNDVVAGFGGNDILLGGEGDDQLNGGAGYDVLNGGAGADMFIFADAFGPALADRIQDFVSGQDRILLENDVFTGLAAGALAAGAFAIGGSAQDADDRIIYDSATGALYFDPDGNGAGAAVQFAVLSGAPALAASDFTVI